MKKLSSILFLLFYSIILYAVEIVVPVGKTTVVSYVDSQVRVADNAELHITSQTPLENSLVNLQMENSWLIFDNIRPNEVIQNWLQYVSIGDEQSAAINGTNVRVEFYINGTVIIPHSNTIEPLQVFDAKNFTGNSNTYGVNYHKSLGAMDNKIRSFKLKRGYMATMSTLADGKGYSRVFIADDEDLEMDLPVLLDQTVSFIRVTKWFYPSKKGWCSSGSNWANEIDITNSTWFYSWSADKNTRPDQEYVPIKQHAGWPSGNEIKGKDNVNHLLGFNEPDRPEQANATVAQAIANWPELMSTGLRLGSPAIADDLNWLYAFIDECERLNYRVDFVALHAYWGGSGGAFNAYTNGEVDINKWYNKLREIHLRTKRPLWITEWNNGANWTNETWPSGTAAQQQKQLKDLQKIIHMLDTCSFVERYSIYNWVEDKRAIVLGNPQYLTPAGEYYRDNKSAMAFNRAKEVIPSWKLAVPEISSFSLTNSNTTMDLRLKVIDDAEMFESYIVEEKLNNNEYKTIYATDNSTLTTKITFDVDLNNKGQYSYRVRAVDRAGSVGAPSKEVTIAVTSANDIQFGKLNISNDEWTTIYFGKEATVTPISILGTATNNNASILMSNRIRNSSNYRLQLKLFPWSYITTSFYTNEEQPYLFLPEGTYDFNGVKALVETVKVNREWTQVSFLDGYFNNIPIVIPTQNSNLSASATSIHLKNVSKDGFEISLRTEANKTNNLPAETIHFIALSEGTGKIGNSKIQTGFVDNVGNLTVQSGTINWNAEITSPLIFTHKQTATNDYASNLRIISYTDSEAKIYNQVERSTTVSPAALSKDQIGWLVINDTNEATSVQGIQDGKNGFRIYPNPVTDLLYFDNQSNESVSVIVRNLLGRVVLQNDRVANSINLSSLANGYYLIQINNEHFKILKR